MSQINLLELPDVCRARGFHLYERQGQRWLDCWLDDGRAICGHRPERLARSLKATIDRGLYAAYPSCEQQRLLRLLAQLHPDFPHVAYYRYTKQPLISEPFETKENVMLAHWRPGWHNYSDWQLLNPVLPLPGLELPLLLMMRQPWDTRQLSQMLGVEVIEPMGEAGQQLSPILAVALKRVVALLLRQPPHWQEPLLGWFDSCPWWQRFGPYLRYCGKPEFFPKLWRIMAQNHILLAPKTEQLSVIPSQLSSGDAKALRRSVNTLGCSLALPPFINN